MNKQKKTNRLQHTNIQAEAEAVEELAEDQGDSNKENNFLMTSEINETIISDDLESEDDGGLFKRLRSAAQTVKWKTAHKNLNFVDSIEDSLRQNDKYEEWIQSGRVLTNLWMFINGDLPCQNQLPYVKSISLPEIEEGTRFEFWHCKEDNTKDFLLFLFKVEPCLVKGVAQELTSTQTLGINVCYQQSKDNYKVVVSTGDKNNIEREIKARMKRDFDFMFDKNIEEKSWRQMAHRVVKRKFIEKVEKAKTAGAGYYNNLLNIRIPQIAHISFLTVLFCLFFLTSSYNQLVGVRKLNGLETDSNFQLDSPQTAYSLVGNNPVEGVEEPEPPMTNRKETKAIQKVRSKSQSKAKQFDITDKEIIVDPFKKIDSLNAENGYHKSEVNEFGLK